MGVDADVVGFGAALEIASPSDAGTAVSYAKGRAILPIDFLDIGVITSVNKEEAATVMPVVAVEPPLGTGNTSQFESRIEQAKQLDGNGDGHYETNRISSIHHIQILTVSWGKSSQCNEYHSLQVVGSLIPQTVVVKRQNSGQ